MGGHEMSGYIQLASVTADYLCSPSLSTDPQDTSSFSRDCSVHGLGKAAFASPLYSDACNQIITGGDWGARSAAAAPRCRSRSDRLVRHVVCPVIKRRMAIGGPHSRRSSRSLLQNDWLFVSGGCRAPLCSVVNGSNGRTLRCLPPLH